MRGCVLEPQPRVYDRAVAVAVAAAAVAVAAVAAAAAVAVVAVAVAPAPPLRHRRSRRRQRQWQRGQPRPLVPCTASSSIRGPPRLPPWLRRHLPGHIGRGCVQSTPCNVGEGRHEAHRARLRTPCSCRARLRWRAVKRCSPGVGVSGDSGHHRVSRRRLRTCDCHGASSRRAGEPCRCGLRPRRHPARAVSCQRVRRPISGLY